MTTALEPSYRRDALDYCIALERNFSKHAPPTDKALYGERLYYYTKVAKTALCLKPFTLKQDERKLSECSIEALLETIYEPELLHSADCEDQVKSLLTEERVKVLKSVSTVQEFTMHVFYLHISALIDCAYETEKLGGKYKDQVAHLEAQAPRAPHGKGGRRKLFSIKEQIIRVKIRLACFDYFKDCLDYFSSATTPLDRTDRCLWLNFPHQTFADRHFEECFFNERRRVVYGEEPALV